MSKFSDTDSDIESPSPLHLKSMAKTGLTTHSTASLKSPDGSPKILHNVHNEHHQPQKLQIRLAQITHYEDLPRVPEKPSENTEVKFFKAVLHKMKTRHIKPDQSLNNLKKIYSNYQKINKQKNIFSENSPTLEKASVHFGESTPRDPFIKQKEEERKLFSDYCLAIIDASIAGEDLPPEWQQMSPVKRMKNKLNLKQAVESIK